MGLFWSLQAPENTKKNLRRPKRTNYYYIKDLYLFYIYIYIVFFIIVNFKNFYCFLFSQIQSSQKVLGKLWALGLHLLFTLGKSTMARVHGCPKYPAQRKTFGSMLNLRNSYILEGSRC